MRDELAVVTGVSGNLGPIWIDALADAGARVVGIDLEAVAPGRAEHVWQADVRDRAALDGIAEELVERYGTPSILVNNAGVDQPPLQGAASSAVEDVALADFLRVLDVNVAGAFNVMQVIGGVMARARAGSIINIGSLYAGVAPDPSFYDHMDPPFLSRPHTARRRRRWSVSRGTSRGCGALRACASTPCRRVASRDRRTTSSSPSSTRASRCDGWRRARISSARSCSLRQTRRATSPATSCASTEASRHDADTRQPHRR